MLLVAVPAPAAERVRTILVFPFDNQSTRANLAWLPEGFAELVSRRLGAGNRYVFGRDQRDAACEQAEVTLEGPLTLASKYQVSGILGAEWAVVGSFNLQGEVLTARAQLFDVRSIRLFPPLEAEGRLSELDDISTRLAWRMLATHDPEFTVGREEDFRRRFPPIHLDAFESYIRGILSTEPDNRIALLTEADRRDPSDRHAVFELGKFYFSEKDYAQANQWLAKVLPNDDGYAEALFMTGVGEFFLGHIPASERAFQALESMVPLGEVANNLGVMESRQRRYEEALAQFDRGHLSDPSDPDFSFNRSVCFWQLKRFDDAAKSLRETLEADPGDTEAHAILAEVLDKLGDTTGREKELGWLAGRGGPLANPSDPGEDFQPLTRLKKNFDGRAFQLLSLALENEREERLAGLPPEQRALAHLDRGKELQAGGWPAEAERELVEAVALDPKSDAAHLALGEVLEAEGKHGDAAAEGEAALRVKDSAGAHLLLANAFLSLHRLDPAREQVRSALDLEPSNPAAQKLMDRIQSLTSGSGNSP